MNNDKLKEEVKKACEILKQGGVILYPTDTIWGLGCDATNDDAVRRIYDIKRREDNKSMLVLIDNDVKLQTYVCDVPDVAWSLIEVSESPLTIIFSGAKNVADNLLGEDGSLGVRITKEAFSKELCRQFRKPIVSTSANITGEVSPKKFKDISEEIKSQVDYIVDYRQNEQNGSRASGIIKLGAGGEVEIIRK